MAHNALIGTVFLLAVFLVLAPLIIHEMGHWAVLRRYRVPVSEYWFGLGPVLLRMGPLRIGMLPIGGAIVPDPKAYAELPALGKLAVALAGPLASLLYAGVFWCAALINQTIVSGEILFTIAHLSFILAVVNLIPVPPLDGFQAWVSWREHKNAQVPAKTLQLAHRVGNGLLYGVGFLVLGLVFLR